MPAGTTRRTPEKDSRIDPVAGGAAFHVQNRARRLRVSPIEEDKQESGDRGSRSERDDEYRHRRARPSPLPHLNSLTIRMVDGLAVCDRCICSRARMACHEEPPALALLE
jgi:hypothetical protein